MQQLKKYGAIGGAISLALCWPLAVGQIGYNVINDGMAQLNSDAVEAEIVSYDRGYLSSTVVTRYVVKDEFTAEMFAADNIPTEILVTSEVKHGLLSLSADSSSEAWPELTLHTDTQLNGNTDFAFKLDSWAAELSAEPAGMFSFAPSTLTGHVTVLGEVDFELNIPSIQGDSATSEKWMITGLTAKGNGKKQKGFWIGDQSVLIENMNIVTPENGKEFEINQGQYLYSAQYDEQNQRVDSNHAISANDVIMGTDKMDKFSADMTFGQLDATGFEKLMLAYENAPVGTVEGERQFMDALDSMMNRGFYVELNKLTMQMGEGTFSSNWKIELPEFENGYSMNPMIVLPKLTGHVDTFVSDQFVADNPSFGQAVDEGVVMEFVSQVGKGYQLKAELKDGQLQFESGQKIALQDMILPLMLGL
ncbi:DUF945 family protein [Vibrio sp. LaRot3]|uniref:DUF945 family protein n=1 Tax=Vibrio sp. LaRot3 TaxID=2998829 RepID=UPI0022CDCC7D|nr:DUF945 family protein [Vibrio sp. LaRot3]MDA0147432.1 DUF945 family protein [Vibrio sp. LaRot3]